MKFSTIILFLLASLNLYAQTILKKVDIQKQLVWRNPYEKEEFYFTLQNIPTSSYKLHFRFNYYDQVIDLYSNDSINFEGKLLNQIIELKQVKTSEESTQFDKYRYIYEIIDLDKKAASKVGRLFLKNKIHEIISNKSIEPEEKNPSECKGINIQFKIQDSIANTSFTCPWEYENAVRYMKVLSDFYKNARKILNTDRSYQKFSEKLDKEVWYSNGIFSFYN